MTLDPTSLGTPVEVASIARELKQLWAADQTRTRASLINFVIVCEGAEAMNANTALLQNIVRDHACRALLIGVDFKAAVSKIQAWVNAHCHLPKEGGKHVCSEQISFYLEGDMQQLLPNLLFSHLESDLPLTLWWQCECPEVVNPELWRWVDRLVFDSRNWGQPKEQFARLHRGLNQKRTVLCDLNWTRTLHLRQGLAQLFDQPEQLAILKNLETVKLNCAANSRTTGLFLLSWFAAQLRWKVKSVADSRVEFTSGARTIVCELAETEGSAISEVVLNSRVGSVVVQRSIGANYLHAKIDVPEHPVSDLLLPADSDKLECIIDDEMSYGGRRLVYLKALQIAVQLLG
jgi:glucose-6-phosphate dehydrogenase assembly protein OpcA